MAVAKDPTKTPPLTAPQKEKPRADVATALDAAAAEDHLKLNDWDNQNDFSAMKNSIRKADQDAEALALLGVGGQEDGPSMYSRLVNEHSRFLNLEDLEKIGTFSIAEILRINPEDLRTLSASIGQIRDTVTGEISYVAGKDKQNYEARYAASSFLGTQQSSGNRTEYRVTAPASVQGDLISAIDKASKITGVPAELLGGMAGIESGFGKNKLSPTGAIGTFQQTGAYRDTNWAKHGDKIAQYVPEAREAMADGLTKNDKRALAFHDESAALMTAYAAKDFAQKRGIDLNDRNNWWIVYAEHNAGAGSVDRLLKGQMPDKFIRDCNPAIYRGANTPEEVIQNYQKKFMAYAKTYDKIEERHYASKNLDSDVTVASAKQADAAIAKASASSAAAIKDGAVASISNKPDDSNLDARDRKLAQSSPAPVIS